MKLDSSFYMGLVIQQAWKYQLLAFPNPAVGALVLKNGEILSLEAHKKAGSAHAELEALKYAYLNKNQNIHTKILEKLENPFEISNYLLEHCKDFFKTCEIFVSLEPCAHEGKTPSCAKLLANLKLKKVYIGTKDINSVASGGIKILNEAGVKTELGVMQKECEDLLYPFRCWNGDNKNFIFFKMAQRLNGSVKGGYISSQDSLKYVHKLRALLSVLVIGGNTFRLDKPSLDTRFLNLKDRKNPNVFVYTRKNKNDFDKNIKAFKIENRKIEFGKNLEEVFEKNKFIMIEGTYSLLEKTYKNIDLLLLVISPKMQTEAKSLLKKNLDFELLYMQKNKDDIFLWLKPN